MAQQVLFDKEATEKILKGVDIVCKAVSGTIGPKGRNAFIEGKYNDLITNDGVTVANTIELQDKVENQGAKMIRNVTAKQNEDVGDGTTTVAVLTHAIIHEALERNENPMEVRESLNEASKKAIEVLKAKSVPSKSEDLKSVALISAENDEIATMVHDLISKLGDKAIISVEDSKTGQSNAELVPGYDAPVGYVSPYFITDPKTGKANFTDVYVLVSEKKLSSLVDLKPIAEIFQENNIGECVFVVDDIDESIAGILVKNNMQGVFKSVVIKAHGEVLEDIAGSVGAKMISEKNGVTWQNVTLEDLGKVQSVSVTANKSVFLGNNVSGALRAAELDGMAETEENQYRKSKLTDRAAKLRGGVGVVRIAANTDYERDYLKLKAEDAIKAVQAAMAEGIVPGGGMALLSVGQELGDSIGEQILKKALKEPFKRIVENAGKKFEDIYNGLGGGGYDAKNNLFVDMFEKGIVDPTKVERTALENAISVAGTFITSFCSISDIPEKK